MTQVSHECRIHDWASVSDESNTALSNAVGSGFDTVDRISRDLFTNTHYAPFLSNKNGQKAVVEITFTKNQEEAANLEEPQIADATLMISSKA